MGHVFTMGLSFFVLLLSIHDARADVESVNSPFYGEVLFDFYQKNYFTSITRLESANTQNRFDEDAAASQILRGGMYLSYGLHREAEDIFKQTLKSSDNERSRAQAMFSLAKLQYQRGFLEKAKSNFAVIDGELPDRSEDERLTLMALIDLQQQNYPEAIRLLDDNMPDADVNYAKYNLAVISMQQGDEEKALKLLDSMSDQPMVSEEASALIDKTNLVLAYHYLGKQEFATASRYFQKIRMQGPFSNKALLGMGWAALGQAQYPVAIAAWKTIVARDASDPAVLEAYLAIPYAHYLQGASKQALQGYRRAVDLYVQEFGNINAGLDALDFSRLANVQALERREDRIGQGWQAEVDPGELLNRYTMMLMASHEFQEGLKNYRDLKFIEKSLQQRLAQLPVFDEMLDVRRQSYQSLLPKAQARLEQLDQSDLAARTKEYKQTIELIESYDIAMALVTPGEDESLIVLKDAGDKLETISQYQNVSQQIHKQRLLNGLLVWDVHTSFKSRLWELKKKYAELVHEYELSLDKRNSLADAMINSIMDFDAYQKKIVLNQTRISSALEKISPLIKQQEQNLHTMLAREFKKVVERIEVYRSQAMLSAAHILDLGASQKELAQ